MSITNFDAERPLLNLNGVNWEHIARNPNSFAQYASILNSQNWGMTPNQQAGVVIGFVLVTFILGLIMGFLIKEHRDKKQLRKRIEALEKHPAITKYVFDV